MSSDEITIVAGGSEKQYWKDLLRYGELFQMLTWRDIQVRYRQTVIGIAWSILRPLLTMIIFTVVFGKIAKLPSNNVPYALLVFVGLVPWQFFSNGVSESSISLIGNANLISKIYFPRLLLPASAIGVSLVDFLISFVFLIGLMVWYGSSVSWQILLLPFFIILALAASFGMGVGLAALNVRYRDVRYVLPFIIQFGLFVSPVGFASEVVPEKWKIVYSLNPLAGIIDGFRWCLLAGNSTIYLPGLLVSIVIVLVLLMASIWYFRKTERTFADVI